MIDLLQRLWVALEASSPAVFPPIFTEDWPADIVERCVKAGVLRPGKPATNVICEECGGNEAVLYREHAQTREIQAYTYCNEGGIIFIPLERLRQWETSPGQVMDSVFAHVPLTGPREELVRDRVWRLGRTFWAGASRYVYFARGLHRSDAWQVMNQAQFSSGSVLFVPTRSPEADTRIEVLPTVIPLHTVVGWHDTALRFDCEFVAAQLAEKSLSDEPAPSAKRGARVTTISALRQALEDLGRSHDSEHFLATNFGGTHDG